MRQLLGSLLREFLFEHGDAFRHLRGIFGSGKNFEIFLVGLDGPAVSVFLLIRFAQQSPWLRQCGLVTRGILKPIDRRVVVALLQVERPDFDAPLRMKGIEYRCGRLG